MKKRVLKPTAAAITAAVVLIAAAAALFMNRGRVFSGIFKDQSGLAMVQEGEPEKVHKKEERRQVLRVYNNDATGVTNPAYASTWGDTAAASIMFEPLMRREMDGSLAPVLAKKAEVSGDGTEYVIQLKKDICFSDGSMLTAEDAAFSIAAMCAAEGEDGSVYQNLAGVQAFLEGQVQMPEGILASDETTLKLIFSRPSPDNLKILETRIQKKPSDLSQGFTAALQQIAMEGVGTGPYVKAATPEGTGIRLEANANYRRKIRDIKTIEFVTYGTYEMGEAVSAGAVDVVVFNGDSACFDLIFGGSQYTIYEKPMQSLYFLSMNRNNQYLYIPQVRQAMALSLDKESYAGGSLSRYLVKADGLVPEDGRTAGDGRLARDEKRARELIEEVEGSYGNLKKRLVLPVLIGNKIQEELAKDIKRDLKTVGLTVDIEIMDQARYLQEVYMLQNFDLILSGTAGWDCASSCAALSSDMQGLPIACNSRELNVAAEYLNSCYSEKTVTEAWKRFNTVCNQQVPVIPLGRPKQYLAVSSDLSGYRINQYDDFFTNIHEIRVR